MLPLSEFREDFVVWCISDLKDEEELMLGLLEVLIFHGEFLMYWKILKGLDSQRMKEDLADIFNSRGQIYLIEERL